MILKLIFMKYDKRRGLDLSQETRWTFGLQNVRGISWPADKLLDSHDTNDSRSWGYKCILKWVFKNLSLSSSYAYSLRYYHHYYFPF
jgi:hypothetical protein